MTSEQSPELARAVERVMLAVAEYGDARIRLHDQPTKASRSTEYFARSERVTVRVAAALRLSAVEGMVEEAERNECEGWRQAKAGDTLRRCGHCVYDLRLRIANSELAAARAACEAAQPG